MKRTPQLRVRRRPRRGGRGTGGRRAAQDPWPATTSRRGPTTCRPEPMSPPGPDQVTGLVVVDKEAGWTSHDVVARCRRIFGQRRVGHAGTLDPDATGVLLVGLGRATRLMRFLTALPKTYEAEVVLGTATSTLDASGEVTGTWEMDEVSLAEVRAAAAALTGPDRAGPAHGVRGQGGWPAPARPGP